MITFNIQARNGNYYRGHEPSNHSSNCWTGDQSFALTLTIEQAREFCELQFPRPYIIAISPKSLPVSGDLWQKEVFCLKGGEWYDYKD